MSSGPKPGWRAGPCIGKPSLQRRTEGISCVFERPGYEIRILQFDGDKPVLLLDLRHDGFYHQHLELPFVEGKLKRRRSRMGLRPPSPLRLKNPRSMSDCGISSIAPFCRREESYSCRTEALEALFTTVSWARRGGGIFPKLKCAAGPESWAAAPSATKESPWRPCPGWWSVKCWTDRWSARGPNAAGENRLCPHTRGPLAKVPHGACGVLSGSES